MLRIAVGGANSPCRVPIVGIGASAGGLDAFKVFFSAMPAESGVAFVLIQHLDPTRESLTAELLGAYTRMRVVQAQDGMPVEPNRVYVIPPNAYLAIRAGKLRVSKPTAPRGLRMAVDFFLRSLADDQRDNAVGIILSGTGTDGTLGLKAIKAGGGMTMVQEPQTAQHGGMPRSAAASGSADHVLPPEKMAAVLLTRAQRAAGPSAPAARPPEAASDALTTVIGVLRDRADFDFSEYKKGTLRRRIQRRMSLRHVHQVAGYAQVLRNDATEVQALFKDLLISVTAFFRDPVAWQVLRERVVRPLIAAKKTTDPLRAWVPACATGEEAYSLAMMLLEEIEVAGKACRLQVFASDVNAEALETARIGIYPARIAEQVSAPRLSRFFIKREHGYEINKELRESVVFARQNVIGDPPFSRLDVISCRNILIYLEPAVHQRLMTLMHFALNAGGYLFLGSAEGTGTPEDLFEPVSAKWRIYRRVGSARPGGLQFPPRAASVSIAPLNQRAPIPTPPRLSALAPRALLQRYAPACVIINRRGEILYFHGRTGDYLAQPDGVPTSDLVTQVRQGLRTHLRDAVQTAIRDGRRVVLAGIQARRGNTVRNVTVSVEPLGTANTEFADLWLVSFEDEAGTLAPAVTPRMTELSAGDSALVQQLEAELRSSKEDLQQTIEDVRAANEELMSVNEELQSSNEELETSKEELQSLNEELTTANTQLAAKIVELEAANNDLDNLLTSTNVATVFLDKRLHVRRFTPSAIKLFSFVASDIGRPIGNIHQLFTDAALLVDAAAVLRQPLTPKAEVQTRDGRWYVRQVLPYRTRDHRTEGVVITFSDVAAEAVQQARLYAESIVATVREPLLVLDQDLRVCSANPSFYAAFHTSQDATVGRLLYELGSGEWNIPTLRKQLGDVLRRGRALRDVELEISFESIGVRMMQLSARAIDRQGDRPRLMLLAVDDVTERTQAQKALRDIEVRKHGEEQLRERQVELAHALRISTIGELASGLAHELNQPLSAIANGVEACARYVRAGRAAPDKLLSLLDEASSEAVRAGSIVEHLRHFIEKGKPQFGRTDLGEIARNVPRLLGREIRSAHITLRLDVHPRSLPIHADQIQIEQIIVNLMHNAIDAIRAAPGKRREIHLKVWKAKALAHVAVRDTGGGVSAAAATRLFEPFFTTKPSGLGMGLAISRSILEAHQGRVWVQRRTKGSRGTTIRFTLPLLPPPKTVRKARAA